MKPSTIPNSPRSRGGSWRTSASSWSGWRATKIWSRPIRIRRRRNIDYLARSIELAPEFGTTVVATETGTRNPDSDWIADPANSSPEAWELLYDALDELVPLASATASKSPSRGT